MMNYQPPLLKRTKRILSSAMRAAAALTFPLVERRGGLWILMYHRVLPDNDPRYLREEPGMLVTPQQLEQQLKTVSTYLTPIDLHEWIARTQSNKPVPRSSVSITFDDGWKDNAEFAFPILEKLGVPATIFVTSAMVDTTRRFWTTQLAELFFQYDKMDVDWEQPALRPLALALSMTNTDKYLNPQEQLSHIFRRTKNFSEAEVSLAIELITKQIKLNSPPTGDVMSSDDMLRGLNSGLIRFGSHTQNHIRLINELSDSVMLSEIKDSKTRIEAITGSPAHLFCYPNGDRCKRSEAMVGKYYRGALLTQKGINRDDIDPFQLCRLAVHGDIASTPSQFKARLSGKM